MDDEEMSNNWERNCGNTCLKRLWGPLPGPGDPGTYGQGTPKRNETFHWQIQLGNGFDSTTQVVSVGLDPEDDRFYISETIDDLESTDDYTCHFKTTDEGLESIGPFFSCLGLKSKLVSYVGTTFTIGVYAYCVFKPTKGGIWYSIILGNPLEKILGIVALAEPYMALLSWL